MGNFCCHFIVKVFLLCAVFDDFNKKEEFECNLIKTLNLKWKWQFNKELTALQIVHGIWPISAKIYRIPCIPSVHGHTETPRKLFRSATSEKKL